MVGLEEMKSIIERLIHLELTFTVITTIIIVVLEDSAECQPPSTVNFSASASPTLPEYSSATLPY